MQITTVGGMVITIGWLLAFLVLILAILGLLSIIPETPVIVFGFVAALALARLL